MKLCLACFKKCEDAAKSCPHCGYGSDAFTHSSQALPVGTMLAGRYMLGKAEFSDEKNLVYLAFDKKENKSCKITEYFPKSGVLHRNGNAPVFKDNESALSDISELKKLKPEGFEENGTFYCVSETAAAPTQKKKNIKRTANKIFRIIAYTSSVICLVLSVSYLLHYYVLDAWLQQNRQQEITLDATATTSAGIDPLEQVRKDYPGVDFPDGMNPAFAELYSQNDEIAGWVKIDGTQIDYAVMQADNNDKYLKTDFFGKATNYGQPYIDYRNSLKTLDRNTIIHGHNMRHDDKIFGVLEEYRKPEAFKASPTIELKTLYGNYTFKIYAVFIINSDPAQDNGKRFYYNFTQATDDEFAKYITELDKRKLYSTGVDICPQDKIITLSTCCYDFSDARLAVVGRLVREGESAEVDTSLVTVNNNIKYPQAYYDAKGNENPFRNDEHLFTVP